MLYHGEGRTQHAVCMVETADEQIKALSDKTGKPAKAVNLAGKKFIPLSIESGEAAGQLSVKYYDAAAGKWTSAVYALPAGLTEPAGQEPGLKGIIYSGSAPAADIVISAQDTKASTGKDGKFSINGRKSFRGVRIGDPSSALNDLTIRALNASSQDILVDIPPRGKPLQVTVVDETGKPAEGAVISCFKAKSQVEAEYMKRYVSDGDIAQGCTLKTDKDGKATVNPRPGSFTAVIASREGKLPATASFDLTQDKQPPAEPIKLELIPASKIILSATTKADKKPLGGLMVSAFNSQTGGPRMMGLVTDANGKATLNSLQEGNYQILLFKKGNQRKPVAKSKVYVGKNASTNIVIEVEPVGTIKGTVKNAAGKGLPEVNLTLKGQGSFTAWYKTGKSGEFVMDMVAPGKYTVQADIASNAGKAADDDPFAIVNQTTSSKSTEVTVEEDKTAQVTITAD